MTGLGPETPGDGEPRYHDECYACPIGGLFLTMHAARPDATEHLLNATSELLQAARAFLDAAEEMVERKRQAGARGGERRVRRIDID